MDEQKQLLDQLNDIVLPENTGLPVAPGWIALCLLLMLIIVFGVRLWRRQRLRPVISSDGPLDWQSPALSELESLESRVLGGDTANVLADSSRLARRILIARTQRSDVAGLTGRLWLLKLDELSGSDFFTQDCGQLLESAPYQKNPVTDKEKLHKIVRALRRLIDSTDTVST